MFLIFCFLFSFFFFSLFLFIYLLVLFYFKAVCLCSEAERNILWVTVQKKRKTCLASSHWYSGNLIGFTPAPGSQCLDRLITGSDFTSWRFLGTWFHAVFPACCLLDLCCPFSPDIYPHMDEPLSLCFSSPCVLTDQRRSSRLSVNRTHTAGKKWSFPVSFYWEAESSLGICGLIVEAVSLLVPLEMEMDSVGDRNVSCGISLACKFDLYAKGIWACLLSSPLAVLAFSWSRGAGGLCLRSKKQINLCVYRIKSLLGCYCWRVSQNSLTDAHL